MGMFFSFAWESLACYNFILTSLFSQSRRTDDVVGLFNKNFLYPSFPGTFSSCSTADYPRFSRSFSLISNIEPSVAMLLNASLDKVLISMLS